MTTVKFFLKDEAVIGFEVSGHSTSDIDDDEGKAVCAAISSACYMAANTVTDVIGINASTKISDGYMKFVLSESDDKSDTVLKGLKLHISELAKQYTNRVKVITEV